MVTMVAAYVLCGELLGVLISRILRLYYIDVAFVWLGGIMLWLVVLVRSTAQLYGVIEHQLQVWIGRLVIQVIKWTDD